MEVSDIKDQQLTKDEEIIKLLRIQNKLLKEALNELTQINQAINVEGLIVEVTDFDMRISSMIKVIFKWIAAYIPVALIIGAIYFVITLVFVGTAFH